MIVRDNVDECKDHTAVIFSLNKKHLHIIRKDTVIKIIYTTETSELGLLLLYYSEA